MTDQVATMRQTLSAQLKGVLRGLFGRINPHDQQQVAQFARQGAQQLGAAQTVMARASAAGMGKQLAAVGVKVDPKPDVPLDVRGGSVSVTPSGLLTIGRKPVTVHYDNGDKAHITPDDMTTEAVLKRPASGFRWIVSEDGTEDDAAGRSGLIIDSIVDNNLMLADRLAAQQTIAQAVNLDTARDIEPRITGYRRVIHPELSRTGTCGLCIAASDRIYKWSKLMPIHDHCHCGIAPVTEEHDPGNSLNGIDLATLYDDGGGTSAAHLKKTRYTEEDHGELGTVLRPVKGTPRGAAQVPATPDVKSGSGSGRGPVKDTTAPALKVVNLDEPAPQTATGGSGNEPPKPPVHNGPISDHPEDPAERLTRLFADQAAGATPEQRDSVLKWQGKDDRFYDDVQRAAEGVSGATQAAMDVVDDLDSLMAPLPENVNVWRGVRNAEAAFGVPSHRLEELEGTEHEVHRFFATSLDRDVAHPEFTTPGKDPVIYKIAARAGAPALWIPPLGTQSEAYQQELLFPPGALVRILGVDRTYSVPIVEVEVG